MATKPPLKKPSSGGRFVPPKPKAPARKPSGGFKAPSRRLQPGGGQLPRYSAGSKAGVKRGTNVSATKTPTAAQRAALLKRRKAALAKRRSTGRNFRSK